MSNWFESHPLTSIISHTIIVGAAVWAFSSFVLDDNKINLYKAQVETSKVQVENSKTISEQYMAKVSALEAELAKSKAENEKYLSWLTSDPKTFPALALKISSLERDLDAAKSKGQSGEASEKLSDMMLYDFSKGFSKGESFVDPKTKAVIGVSDITPQYTAIGAVVLPDGKKIDLKDTKPGESWDFSKAGKNYRLTLDSVNWINNSLKASVSEVPE